MPVAWTADNLFEFLVTQAGLPPTDRPEDLDVTFADIGLDSLAYLQLQVEVNGQFGAELPADPPEPLTLRQILATVNSARGQRKLA